VSQSTPFRSLSWRRCAMLFALYFAFVFPTLPAMAGSPIGGSVWSTPEDVLRAASTRAGNAGSFLLKTAFQVGYVATPRIKAEADVTVTGILARTTITRHYRNTADTTADGLFVFSLPNNTKLHSISLTIGERVIKSRMAPRSIVSAIPANSVQFPPAVSDNGNLKLLSLPVSRIEAGQTVIVRIEYQQRLRTKAGAYTLRLPLKSWPAQDADPFLHAARAKPGAIGEFRVASAPLSLQIRLDAGASIEKIWSPSHPTVLKRTGPTTALVSPTAMDHRHNTDFALSWTIRQDREPSIGLFSEKADGADHLMVMITPPRLPENIARISRDVVFVLDVANTVSDRSAEFVRNAVSTALARLNSTDRFNVIRVGAETTKLFPTAVPASQSARSKASVFLSRADWGNDPNLIPALKKAFRDESKTKSSRPRQVILLTGGHLKEASALSHLIAKRAGTARLFVVGIGESANEAALKRLAEIGHGRYLPIPSERNIPNRLSGLFSRLEQPVMTDLKATWTVGAVTRAWPDPLPDLYADEPLLISAKIAAPSGTLTLQGKIAGRKWSKALKMSDARSGLGLAPLWAERKIASIEARRFMGQTSTIVDKAIQDVAVSHQVPSRLTTLVAVDGDTVIPVLPILQPITIRDDLHFEAHADNKLSLEEGSAGSPGVADKLALFDAKRRVTATEVTDRPTTGLPFALLALIILTTSLVTFGLWAHLRREYVSMRRDRRKL